MTTCHFNMTAEDNFRNLCNLTTSLMGLTKGSLAYKSRRTELQVPRAVASVIARIEDNTHHSVIAKVLKRDRTLVYHYERAHEANYSSWAQYRDTFNKVYTAYTSIINAKKEFFDLPHLKNHLKENGVRNSSKHQTTLRVQCGKVGTDIKVSYREFYNQLELCKLALQDYKYQIEII